MTHPPTAPAATTPVATRTVTAIVEVGDQRGRLLGFPTANLHPADCDLRPRGVYAAVAVTADGTRWPAAVNVGTRPTFTGGGVRPSVEVHLIGFDGNLYGQTLTVDFLAKLRDEVHFESVGALVAQLHADIEAAADAVEDATWAPCELAG